MAITPWIMQVKSPSSTWTRVFVHALQNSLPVACDAIVCYTVVCYTVIYHSQ